MATAHPTCIYFIGGNLLDLKTVIHLMFWIWKQLFIFQHDVRWWQIGKSEEVIALLGNIDGFEGWAASFGNV